jgi:crotonobetainyl-CoA:carnitine CoA-transferase CaiB-like acyl-CoA transferase
MAEVSMRHRTSELRARFEEAGIPHAPIQTIAEVREMQAVARKLTTTRTPDGRTIRLPPAAVDLATTPSEYAFAPRYGEHTGPVLREAGFSEEEIAELRAQGIVPA